jgi:hypothetical protein
MPFTGPTPIAPTGLAPQLEQPPTGYNPPAPDIKTSAVIGAAFRQENDILNAVDLLTQKQFDHDPEFDLVDYLQKNHRELIETGQADFLAGSRNATHVESLVAKREREFQDKRVLERAGAAGYGWAMAAGVLSPTTFIPLVGVASKGARAAAEGAALTGAAVAGQEVVLQANQLERTALESGMAMTAGVVLGGILGGAVGLTRNVKELRRAVEDEWVRKVETMVDARPPEFGQPNSVGAAVARVAPDGTVGILDSKVKFGKGKVSLEQFGPVTRALNNALPTARWGMAQFTNAGLRLAGKDPTGVYAPGGLVEDLAGQWRGNLQRGLQGVDAAYAKYMLGEKALNPEGNARFGRSATAFASGMLRRGGKMRRDEFYSQVDRAIWMGRDAWDDAEILPEIRQAATALEDHIYKPMLEEGKKVGIFPEEIKTVGDLGYLNRIYNTQAIKANEDIFRGILERHFTSLLANDFAKGAKTVQGRIDEAMQLRADLDLPEEAAADLQKQLEREMVADTPAAQIIEELQDLRDMAADASGADASDILKKMREIKTQNADVLKDAMRGNTALKRRLRNLNKTVNSLQKQQARKMTQVERLEEQQMASLERLVRKVNKLIKEADKLDEAKIVSEIERLQAVFKASMKTMKNNEDRLAKLWADDPVMKSLRTLWADPERLKLEGRVSGNMEKVARLSERLEDKRMLATDRNLLMEDLAAIEEGARQSAVDLIEKKAWRKQKLREDIENLDPQRALEAADERIATAKEKAEAFEENLRTQGFEDINLAEGTANIFPAAKAVAAQITESIKKQDNVRVVGIDMLRDKKGPELKRMLTIKSSDLIDIEVNGQKINFLETDSEKLARAYVRTMAADIEITRRFGSVNAASLFEELNFQKQDMLEAAKGEANKAAVIERLNGDIKKAKEAGKQEEVQALQLRLEGVKQELSTLDINKAFEDAQRDLGVVISRMRHERGLPQNPDGFAARGARLAMNLNTMRFMGMVLISSIPDMARGVQKYGLGRFYKSGLKPLFTNLKSLKLNMKEANLAGTALDIFLHTRMMELAEMMDDFGRRSKFEQGVEFATSKIGVLGGFDYWNTGAKSFAAMLFNAEALDAVRTIVTGKAGAKSVDKATKFLADLQITGDEAADIWRLVEAGGGGEVKKDFWLPNTEDWADAGTELKMRPERVEHLLRKYRAALAREVDAIVVTPGLERPNWMDGSTTGKVLGQFRSFAVSSTFKTTMAGLQQKDTNFMLGSAMALGMGALSYQLWALASGNDTGDDYDKWLDEAIDRSGTLGIFGEVRNVGSTIPWLNDYVMFSGEQTVRRGGTGFAMAALGPSGDLLFTASRLLSNADDPTVSTGRDMKKLLPYQNLWWLRQFYDGLLESAGLPDQRQ